MLAETVSATPFVFFGLLLLLVWALPYIFIFLFIVLIIRAIFK